MFRAWRMRWEKMFTTTDFIQGKQKLQRALAAPGALSGSRRNLNLCCSNESSLALPGRCSSRSLAAACVLSLPVSRWCKSRSRNLGTAPPYSKSGFISFLMCVAVIPVSHLILIFQSYFLQRFWLETVLIVSLQLNLPRIYPASVFSCGFSQRVNGNAGPKNRHERTLRMSTRGGLGDMCLLLGTSPPAS